MLDIDKLQLSIEELAGLDAGPFRDVADAQFAKLAWGIVDWLEGHPVGTRAYAIKVELKRALRRAGMERPKEKA